MKLPALALGLLLSGSLSEAVKLSVTQRKQPKSLSQKRSGTASFRRPVLAAASNDDDGDLDLSSFHDLLYIANVTVGGSEYPLQLDTGSSDLWVKGDTSPLPNANSTALTLNITYGIGSTYGHISYTPVEFAGISVPKQAFIDASQASNPILNYGVDGIVGLGFTKLSSVDVALTNSGKSDGKSLLYNLFADNPTEPNFIAFALQRTTEKAGDVEGSFSIGEYDEDYKDVANQPKISTYPENDPTRWTVLLDALLIGDSGSATLSSTVSGAPSGKAVVMLDSGTSYTYAPEDVCNAIYGSIQGASYNSALGQWIVPCDAEVDIALQFGSHIYPIHPLDVTPVSLSDDSMCVGSFLPQTVSVGAGQFDWLIGDNVMRSFYTVYDFGDFDASGKMGNPYMQILPLVDPNEASTEFHKLRGGSASSNITYNAQNVSSAASSSSGSNSVDVSSELTDTLNKLQTYIPAILAIMALNALVILVLAVAGIVYMCRRRTPHKLVWMPMGRGGDALGAYQPVSMALTEDTFVPPTPAFSKPGFDGSTVRAGDRPKSVA
ncbi:aspartic peptidase domain-containing protein [Cerioporus squamosus]|nr:aspartic peptidase domain-containing protein [Cerioporus squamosus]